ncbi:MAG: glycosyltransferase family 9 protein [Elusimicrobiaceae bacterium]
MTFLFILLDHKIGDTIVISYIFRELKKLFSNSKIYVVVDKNIEELYQAVPYVNETLIFDRQNMFSSMLHLLYTLRVHKYDFCIGNIRNFNRKIFFKLLKYRKFLPLVTILGVHSAKHGLPILEYFSNINFDTSYNLTIPDSISNKIQTYLSGLPIRNKKVIIFNPIGSEQNRILSEQKVKAIIALLQQYKDYAIFLLDYKKMYNITEKMYSLLPVTVF